jgi:hypothetical protein
VITIAKARPTNRSIQFLASLTSTRPSPVEYKMELKRHYIQAHSETRRKYIYIFWIE